MADIGIGGASTAAAQLRQPAQRLPERPPIQENLEVSEATRATTAVPELSATDVATGPAETRGSGDDASNDPSDNVSLSQLTQGAAQQSDAPRSQQQIDNQRQQLQDSVARTQSPAPEPEIDAQA